MRPQTKKTLQALAILIGTIVGLGPFGIPYAFAHAGFFVGLVYLVVLAGVVLLMHLIYGEIVLRTQDKHRLIGYAEIYLGSRGKRIATISTVVGVTGILLAYTIVGGIFSKVLFGSVLDLGTVTWSMLFFALMAFFVITDFKNGAPAELVMSAGLLTAFIIIIVRTVPDISLPNFSMMTSTQNMFLPYGVVFFALTGSSAIPELRDVLMGDGRMQRIIVIGTLIPAILYGLFAFGVVGAFGTSITKDAVMSLAERYGTWMSVVGGLVGLLTTATSFIVLALVLKHAFIYDLKLSTVTAVLLVLGLPLTLFALATRDFLTVIGFIGGVLGGVEGLLLLKLHWAAKTKGWRTPEYSLRLPKAAYVVLAFLFITGIIYEMVYTIL